MKDVTKGVLVVGVVLAASAVLLPWPDARADSDRRASHLAAPTHAVFEAECGACHLAYPPGLLPAVSWTRIMAGLEQHFGENAALAPAVAADIRAYLMAHAADAQGMAWRWGEAADRAAQGAPLRITGTAWFKHEHDEIAETVWRRPAIGSPANCGACHRDAVTRGFDEHRIRIPE
ncbi:MAG: diheme cytochrome c [Rhodocyclaceae bacterium]|nr:diheme cytochrome c [Rhodocyclaceae bacterium]